MDCIVQGVTKNWTGLNGFHFYFQTVITLNCIKGELNKDELDRAN